MNKLKKYLALFLALAMILPLIPVLDMSVLAATTGTTGTCTWSTSGNVLTIRPTDGVSGEMKNYKVDSTLPWRTGTGITSVVIEEGVTNVSRYAFYNCKEITSVSMPSTLASLGDNAFVGCSALTSVTIASANTTFKVENNCILEKSNDTGKFDLLFYNFAGTEVTIPSSVVKVGAFAFNNRTNLTKVIVTAKVKEIAENAFLGCSSFAFEATTGNSVFRSENGYLLNATKDTLIFGGNGGNPIPDSVTAIGKFAFFGRTGITSITIPETVTKINSHAFNDCTDLVEITLPANGALTSIGVGAFAGCTSLASVTIPNKVTEIGRGAFIGCNSLEHLVVLDNNPVYKSENNCILSKDGTTLFFGCKGSTIPSGVTAIGDYAFDSCTGITSMTIPSGVTSIGDFAFVDCSNLKSVVIADSVTEIGTRAFFGCKSLSSVTLPNGNVKLGSHLFGECTSLTSLTLPEGITAIDPWTFAYCTALKKIVVPGSVTSIGEAAFLFCEALTEVVLPANLESIAYGAFDYCNALTDVWFCVAEPDSVSTFENGKYVEAAKHYIDNACDATCNDCGATRTSAGHAYDNMCDTDCNQCGVERTITHTYGGDCDTACNVCGYERVASNDHSFTNDCDGDCDLCGVLRAARHDYSSACDEICNSCSTARTVAASHSYDDNCDRNCNACDEARFVVHIYSSACDTACDRCEAIRTTLTKHSYSFDATSGMVVCDTCEKVFAYTGTTGDCYYYLDGTALTVFGNGAMGYDTPWGTEITTVAIMEGVTKIGARAFLDCKNLTSVVIPVGVTVIGEQAFSGCTALSDLTLSAGLAKVEENAFADCNSLKNVWFRGTPAQASTIEWKKDADTQNPVISGSGTAIRPGPLTGVLPGTGSGLAGSFGVSAATWHYTSITARNFSLHSSINANLYAAIDSALTAESIVMRFTMNGKETVIEGTLVSGNTYMFVFEGIAPQCMNDTIVAELIVNGEVWDVKSFSVRAYCDSMFAMSADDLGYTEAQFEAAKKMMLDLLNYGSMAQQYMNYKTDSFANKGLADAEAALKDIMKKEWANELGNEWNKALGVSDGVAELKSASVWFDNENRLYFRFAASDVTETNFFVRITDSVTGQSHDYTLSQFEVLSEGIYGIFSEPISVCNFNHGFEIALYSLDVDYKGERVETAHHTLSNYGINSYIYSMQNKVDTNGDLTNMALLARACYCYGASAHIYDNLV